MKKRLKDKALILLILIFSIACQRNSFKEDVTKVQEYTCSMHPQIVKEAPGSCPICGMHLVPIRKQHNNSDTLSSLLKGAKKINLSTIKTVRPETGSRFTETKVRGVIAYNSNSFKVISSRVSGRIERLFIQYNFQAVSKGQKIMEVYSPDLASAQQELIFLKNNSEPALLQSAKRKLSILGMNDLQINQVLKSGKVNYKIPIYSFYSGFITENISGSQRAESAPITGSSSRSSNSVSAMNSMGNGEASIGPLRQMSNSSEPVLLKEGQYVSAGQKLFNIISAENVLTEFYVSPSQAKALKKGVMLRVNSADQSSKSIRVPVHLIQPFYKDGTNYMLVKAKIPNEQGRWKIGELVDVSIENTRMQGAWIPKSAVLNIGTRNVVFIIKENALVPAYVQVKQVAQDAVDIGNSFPAKTEIAESAWFIADPESFIKPEKQP